METITNNVGVGAGILQPAITNRFKIDFKLFNRELSSNILTVQVISYELKLIKPKPSIVIIFEIDIANRVLDEIYKLFNTVGNMSIIIHNMSNDAESINELKFNRCKLESAICKRSYGDITKGLPLHAEFTFEKMTNSD